MLYNVIEFIPFTLIIIALILIAKGKYMRTKQNKPVYTEVEWCTESKYCETCKKKGTCRVWQAIIKEK